jgi:hypothetical protein
MLFRNPSLHGFRPDALAPKSVMPAVVGFWAIIPNGNGEGMT